MHLLGSNHGGKVMKGLIDVLHGSHMLHESRYFTPPHLYYPCTTATNSQTTAERGCRLARQVGEWGPKGVWVWLEGGG